METARQMADAEGYEYNADGIITSPGRYEGEHVDVLYWHSLAENGEGDPTYEGDMVVADRIPIFAEDRNYVSVPEGAQYVVISCSDEGFVHFDYMEV